MSCSLLITGSDNGDRCDNLRHASYPLHVTTHTIQSECRQLLLCVRFIRENRSMLAALQKKDWKVFARLYNGPAYAQNRYDEKLSTAYSSFNK
ncbi:MAG: N-acetylmuramidase family protein [Prevotella ruminicola]|uniref:N-acetylmuramidase family protein n=1 Tax=Xylanibacter ruminicola TaxID=839 RepID=A0A9D5P4Z1_XYLRU|nr:N-acetylmuramidase family protein [Xylanibacter ruminicola]